MTIFKAFYVAFFTFPFISGCLSKPPVEIGLQDGRLLPCPKTPNCVSTMAEQADKYINLLAYTSTREDARITVKQIIKELEGTTIKEESSNFFWVECQSRLFGFVDDLEIYLPEEAKVIHFRSASRLGYSDFGVNKKRIEHIRKLFNGSEKGGSQP